MHFPGERTLRALVARALRPVSDVGRALDLPAKMHGLRQAALDAHLAWSARGEEASADLAWARLHHRLSERGGYFFSENVLSNERGFLAPAQALSGVPRGLAYLGVGPEQTFSYVGLLGASMAFVLDVRRDNARLHFLYRALFEEAESRSEWLALLLGRPFERAADPGPLASIEEVLAQTTSAPPTRASFRAAHARVLARIERWRGLLLPGDRGRLRRLHAWFWERQLELTFQVQGPRLRIYPTLRDQLLARAPDGRRLGFLAAEERFRAVQAMQRGARVVPVTGDLAGDFAVRAIASELRGAGQEIGAIYVSNVEQYLFERGLFARWIENLRALPCHRDAVLVRAYPESEDGRPAPDGPKTLLGQIRRSATIAARAYLRPEGKQVHVMPTVAHRLGPFLDRAARYRTFRDIVCDREITVA